MSRFLNFRGLTFFHVVHIEYTLGNSKRIKNRHVVFTGFAFLSKLQKYQKKKIDTSIASALKNIKSHRIGGGPKQGRQNRHSKNYTWEKFKSN